MVFKKESRASAEQVLYSSTSFGDSIAFSEESSHFKIPAKRFVWHKIPTDSPGIIFARSLSVSEDRIVEMGRILFFMFNLSSQKQRYVFFHYHDQIIFPECKGMLTTHIIYQERINLCIGKLF